ncbi:hypothetical protein [Actinomadura hibisca]|uniref:hypothetical protein n=1 Tax=Actinomadura hibisca TaxID=68565 RepID=UPI001FE077CB|nr:hypothetical protein [Actinomadura hibisca]
MFEMKLVVQVKLEPTPEQAAVLAATLHATNQAANWVSETAFATGVKREYALRKLTYAALKEQGLGAQAAQHVIKKVCDAYAALAAHIRTGRLRGRRRRNAQSRPSVRIHGQAQPGGAGPVRVSELWARLPRRPQRFPQHRRPRRDRVERGAFVRRPNRPALAGRFRRGGRLHSRWSAQQQARQSAAWSI